MYLFLKVLDCSSTPYALATTSIAHSLSPRQNWLATKNSLGSLGLPPELRAYCCKLANTTQINKDDRLRLAEFGLINLDELDSMSSRELNTMKSIITASGVNERVAYGNIKKPMPLNRLGVLLGTAGYKDVRHKIGGVRTRGWLVYQRNSDEIDRIKDYFKE